MKGSLLRPDRRVKKKKKEKKGWIGQVRTLDLQLTSPCRALTIELLTLAVAARCSEEEGRLSDAAETGEVGRAEVSLELLVLA